MSPAYDELVQRRRLLRIEGFFTLADVGCDGPWITPFQIKSRSAIGPVLVALHWLDEPTIGLNRPVLLENGYLPSLRFNQVLDLALRQTGIGRSDIYVTQAFHLIPRVRSERIPTRALDQSFDQITRYELVDRKVIALGMTAARLCRRHGIAHEIACHPSRRAHTNEANAGELVAAMRGLYRQTETRLPAQQ